MAKSALIPGGAYTEWQDTTARDVLIPGGTSVQIQSEPPTQPVGEQIILALRTNF